MLGGESLLHSARLAKLRYTERQADSRSLIWTGYALSMTTIYRESLPAFLSISHLCAIVRLASQVALVPLRLAHHPPCYAARLMVNETLHLSKVEWCHSIALIYVTTLTVFYAECKPKDKACLSDTLHHCSSKFGTAFGAC